MHIALYAIKYLSDVTTMNINFRYNILHKSRLLQAQRRNAKKQRYIHNKNKLLSFISVSMKLYILKTLYQSGIFSLKILNILMSCTRWQLQESKSFTRRATALTLSCLSSRLTTWRFHFIHNYSSSQKKISMYCKTKKRQWGSRYIRVRCWSRVIK